MFRILGVKIDSVTRAQALEMVSNFLIDGGQNTIFTPNPEMIVDAQKDEYFKTILNSGSLNICDGKGIQLVSRGLERIPGTDFMLDICRLAEEQNRGVYLLGSGSDEVATNTAQALKSGFPRLNIVGYDKGPRIPSSRFSPLIGERPREGSRRSPSAAAEGVGGGLAQPMDSETPPPASPKLSTSAQRGGPAPPLKGEGDSFEETVNKINKIKPDILFVAFGHRKQEIWIHENLHKLPSVKVAMGVGGAFDYISGNVKRAPCSMRKIGLEWMYRLLIQPQRFNRILKATIKFIWLVSIKKSKF